MTDSTAANTWLKAQQVIARGPLRQLRLFAPLLAVLIVLQCALLAFIINGAVFEQQGLNDLLPWLYALLPVFAGRFLLTWQAERQAFRAALLIKQRIRHRLFDKLRELGPVHLANHDSGSLATTLVDGVESLEPYFARFLPAMIMMSMIPLIIVLAALPADWVSGLVMLLTAPLVPLFMTLIGKGAERMNQRQWRTLTRMGGYFLSVIQTLPTLKMFNASRRELRNIEAITDEFRRTTMSVLRVAFLTSALLEFFAALSIALIAVFVGFRLLAGEMSFLYGFFVLLLAPEFFIPLRNYGVQNHARMEAAGAAEQIAELLATPSAQPLHALSHPKNQDMPIAPSEQPAQHDPVIVRSTSDTLTEAQQGVAKHQLLLSGLYFSYDQTRPALNGVDLQIEPGQHLAIVGPSGSGKTTLAHLMLGFAEPDRGQIQLGDTLIGAHNLIQWRQQISWVPQKARLFHASVADNIRLGAPEATLERVIKAAEQAHARDFIEQLPNGFDTLIGEGGQGLSGGQIQRIALARALLRDSPFILLDEPTAHLDRSSEQAITEVLQQLKGNRTLISIAHRLHTLQQADQVVVLQQGKIVQQGSFSQLASHPGPFAELLQDSREVLG